MQAGRNFKSTVVGALLATVAVITMASCAKSATPDARETSTVAKPSASGAQSGADLIGPMKRIKVGEVDYAYHTFGKGKPLVMIMGFTGTMSIWDTRLLADLASAHQVTIFDNRGIGFSTDTASGPLTMESMADSTVEMIKALELSEPDIVGWSMGGEIALTIAIRHGDKVNKVVAISADPGSANAVYAKEDIDRELSDPSATFEQLMHLLFPDGAEEAEKQYLESLKGIEQPPPSPQGVTRQAAAEDAYASSTSNWNSLGSIKNPVLLMTGDRDEVVPGENSIIMAGKIPGAWLAQFPGTGHGLPAHEPDRVAAVINNFLAV